MLPAPLRAGGSPIWHKLEDRAHSVCLTSSPGRMKNAHIRGCQVAPPRQYVSFANGAAHLLLSNHWPGPGVVRLQASRAAIAQPIRRCQRAVVGLVVVGNWSRALADRFNDPHAAATRARRCSRSGLWHRRGSAVHEAVASFSAQPSGLSFDISFRKERVGPGWLCT